MNIKKELEEQLIHELNNMLVDAGFNAKVLKDDNRNTSILELHITNVGDREDNHIIEIMFLPASEEFVEQNGFNILQIFASMGEKTSIDCCNELARSVLKINRILPNCSYGVDEKTKTLYYKSNCIITDNMSMSSAKALIEVQLGLYLSFLAKYNDVLMDMIDGNRTAKDAIKKGLI